MSDLFNCFRLTPVSRVKCVILGQDPYHGPGQAMGLSFSVPDGVPKPPSLVNIFTEMESDVHVPEPRSGNLLQMGGGRRSAPEYRPHRTRGTGEFSPQPGMGAVYGFGDPQDQRTLPARLFSSLGKQRTQQKAAD